MKIKFPTWSVLATVLCATELLIVIAQQQRIEIQEAIVDRQQSLLSECDRGLRAALRALDSCEDAIGE